jgi:ADP-heptose:LPS heptosyltransferase
VFFQRFKKRKKIAFCLGHGCGLGNMIQALPAIQALSESGHIVDMFLSESAYGDMTEVVRGQPYLRHIYENTYDNEEELYDLCVVSFLSPHRVANARSYLKLTTPWKKRSEYEQYCGVAQKLGARTFTPPRLNRAPIDFKLTPVSIVIHAGCSKKKMWERKRWPHYHALIELLLKDGCNVYCCGKEDEGIDHPGVTAYLKLPLPHTIALIEQGNLFVSNDSGLMHIAAALRKKQVAIFTATSIRKNAPSYNPYAHVIAPELPCAPCQGNDEAWTRCREWKCRDAVTVEKVHHLIKRVIRAEFAV